MKKHYHTIMGSILLLFTLYAYSKLCFFIEKRVDKYSSTHFDPFSFAWILVLIPVIAGLLLSIPYLYRESKKPGNWTFNRPLFFSLVLPLLLITFLQPLLGYVGKDLTIPSSLHEILFNIMLMAKNPMFPIGAGLFFSFSLQKSNH